MNNEKILNLTDVETDDFNAIKRAIEDWKSSGYGGEFMFVSEKVIQEAYNRGVWHGGFALIGGICLGTAIYFVADRVKTKKGVDESQ